MPVFTSAARQKADRIAAVVGLLAFAAGIAVVVWGAMAPSSSSAVSTTIVSSPIPGGAVSTTVRETAAPISTNPPKITQDETIVEGTGPGTYTVTTAPPAVSSPLFGSTAADLAVQVILVTLAAFLIAFGTHRVLLGEYGLRTSAGSFVGGAPLPRVEEKDAAALKRDVASATEAPDLSRPLYEKAPVTDPRLRLLQSRIALELEVRTLAQNNDLPSGLSIPYVVKGLVDKKKMTPKLAAAITGLQDIGDRLGRGAEISLDTTTLLTEAYAQALAKVGGKIK